MSNQHVLKIHPAPLADLLSGAKTAEVRRNDRGFQVGDTVRLMEVNPETLNWTGRPDLVRTISHIQTGYGLPDGLCVVSYAQAEQQGALGAQAGDELKRLSVTNILLDVVPGPDGMGHEVYAKSVEQVERRLCDLGDRVEELTDELAKARAALATQPAAAEPVAEFFVEFATLRRAMSIYGLSAPESNHELGSRMERYAIRVIEAVAKLPFPTSAAAHVDEAVRKDAELPPLPESTGDITYRRPAGFIGRVEGFTRVQMRDYALAAIDAAMRAQGDGETKV